MTMTMHGLLGTVTGVDAYASNEPDCVAALDVTYWSGKEILTCVYHLAHIEDAK